MKDEKDEVIDLRSRTRGFALKCIRLYSALPKTTEAQILGKQMLRSGTSVGAHYRESVRAKSDADFISKIEGALQELEETAYWLELLCEAGIMHSERTGPVLSETGELIAILTTMAVRVKNKQKNSPRT